MEKIHKHIFLESVATLWAATWVFYKFAGEKYLFLKELLKNCFVFTVFLLFSFNCTEQPLSAKVS